MNADADLSPPGLANADRRLPRGAGADGVTIVGNDSGGAISQVLATRRPERVGRLVLTNCDTHENFPPSAFKLMPPLAKLPGAMTVMSLPFRLGPVRRAAVRAVREDQDPRRELIDSWMEPSQRDAAVRRDTAKVTAGLNKRYTLEAAERLRIRPPDPVRLGTRGPLLQALATRSASRRRSPTPGSRRSRTRSTFVSLDQPKRLAELIAAFIRGDLGGAEPRSARPLTQRWPRGRLRSPGTAGRRPPRAGSAGRPWP